MAKVSVFYDGVFAGLTGREKEWVELEVSDFSHLVDKLSKDYGDRFREAVLDTERMEVRAGVSVLNNGRRVELKTLLQEGDEVAFLISIAGGADG
jgi:molybdopterin converting factor small subunit